MVLNGFKRTFQKTKNFITLEKPSIIKAFLLAEKERFRNSSVRYYFAVIVHSIYAHALATPPSAAFAELCIINFFCQKKIGITQGDTYLFWQRRRDLELKRALKCYANL